MTDLYGTGIGEFFILMLFVLYVLWGYEGETRKLNISWRDKNVRNP